MPKRLMRGSQVLGEAAMLAGCRFYFGHAGDSGDQMAGYLSARLPQVGGSFLRAESELSAVNMAIGAAMAGGRVMTSASSPGLSLMQEGISFLAALELPAVIAGLMRGGPGMGNNAPAQGDYFQATRGGGHGDYRCITLAPASCQELCDLTITAFDLADRYRNPAVILADGMLGRMMEPVELPPPLDPRFLPAKEWALGRAGTRPSRALTSLRPDPKGLEAHNYKLVRKYDAVQRDQARWQEHRCDDARLVVVAYGTAARIAKGAIRRVRDMGLAVGLFRPITLWPFPAEPLLALTRRVRQLLVFEMSTGQMVEDVELAVRGRADVNFHGRPGGVVPTPEEVAHQISHYYYRAYPDHDAGGAPAGGGA